MCDSTCIVSADDDLAAVRINIADCTMVRVRALRLDEEHHTREHPMEHRRPEYEPRLRRAGVKPGADSVAKGVHLLQRDSVADSVAKGEIFFRVRRGLGPRSLRRLFNHLLEHVSLRRRG